MRRKITLTGANTVFLIFVILFFVFQLVLIFFTLVFGENFIDRNVYKILLINQYVLILIPVLAYMVIGKFNFKEVFRLNKLSVLPGIIIVFLSVPAYFVASMLNSLVVFVLQFIGNIHVQPIPVPGNEVELIIGILIVAVSPAICEELLHRGVLLRAYENRGTTKAIVITSIFFGIFHFDLTNLLGPIFLGLLIGYYVVRTNSIFAGMLAHFLNNSIAELLQYFFSDTSKAEKVVSISTQQLGGTIIYGIVGLIFVSVFIALFKYVTRSRVILKPSISSIKNDIISIASHWPIIVVAVLYVFTNVLYILSLYT